VQALVIGITKGGLNLDLPSLNTLRKFRSVADLTQILFRLSKQLSLCYSGRGGFIVGEIVGSKAGI